MIQPLGIDNVFFTVTNLGEAVAFYERCGLTLKFRIDAARIALFAIGSEEPGLMLREGEGVGAGRLWLEVADAEMVSIELGANGIASQRLETATGVTVEVADPSGNIVGFADYSKRRELGRH